MPDVTVYIRKEDVEKWKAFPGKAEAIHQLLNRSAEATMTKIKLPQSDKPIYVPKSNHECPNGHALDDYGYCFGKGCKYNR